MNFGNGARWLELQSISNGSISNGYLFKRRIRIYSVPRIPEVIYFKSVLMCVRRRIVREIGESDQESISRKLFYFCTNAGRLKDSLALPPGRVWNLFVLFLFWWSVLSVRMVTSGPFSCQNVVPVSSRLRGCSLQARIALVLVTH